MQKKSEQNKMSEKESVQKKESDKKKLIEIFSREKERETKKNEREKNWAEMNDGRKIKRKK